jgi:hypothetical protein
MITAVLRLSLPVGVVARCYGQSHDLSHGRPVAALINVDDLADLEDRAALAAHLADKAAGRGGISLEELDTAFDRIDAERTS